MADDNKRWQDMTPDEQAVLIRQIYPDFCYLRR
jgi:hypothetical protein